MFSSFRLFDLIIICNLNLKFCFELKIKLSTVTSKSHLHPTYEWELCRYISIVRRAPAPWRRSEWTYLHPQLKEPPLHFLNNINGLPWKIFSSVILPSLQLSWPVGRWSWYVVTNWGEMISHDVRDKCRGVT